MSYRIPIDMDSRLMLEMVKEKRLAKKRIECALAEFEVQRDIEVDRKTKRELETEWILHGGKMPQ